MTKPIWILNGPNLNLLGVRAPEVYGTVTLSDIEADCRTLAAGLGLELDFRQTNGEGTLVDWIQEARTRTTGVILNAGAYTHTSLALGDACEAYDGHLIEVHLSNVHAREAVRRHSFVSPHAAGVIAGCGANGYGLALRQIAHLNTVS